MKIIITKSGPERSWYSESIGQTFEVIEPPTWAIGNDDNAFYIEHSHNSTGVALYVWKEDCELVLPQAIGTNEQPSSVATEAVEPFLILTEEELNACENTLGSNYWAMQASLEKVIDSHRNLFSANAELSFKNMKLVNSLKSISESSTNLADSLRIQAHLTLEELK